MSLIRLFTAFALGVTCAGAAGSQTIAITNARIETAAAAGSIESGTLVIRDGRIAAVGAVVPIPSGAKVIDAKGQVVTPGFIAPSSSLMVNEVGQLSETRDDGTGDRLSAGFDVQYGINPDSPRIGIVRMTGVTQAVIAPTVGKPGSGHEDEGGALQGTEGSSSSNDPLLFGGQAAIVRLDSNNPDPLVKARVAVTLDLGEEGAMHAGGSRGAAIVFVKSALDDARSFARNRAAYERGDTRAFGLSRVDLEALVPVTERKIPLLIRVNRAADIRQTLNLAREENIRVILEGAAEGWRVAREIAAAEVPVILDPQEDLPASFDTIASRLDNAALLQKAGVLIAIRSSRDLIGARPIRLNAGAAVPYGLSWQQALAAITLNPAKIWGVADRSGSLEVGKDADVVVWNADPLEILSYPVTVLIKGVEQPMTSRRQELRDRYLKQGEAYPPGYH